MRILKEGKMPPPRERKFAELTCRHCSTVFEAELGEVLPRRVGEQWWSRTVVDAKCPFCGFENYGLANYDDFKARGAAQQPENKS